MAEFLEQIGLGHLTDTFQDEDIDDKLFGSLRDGDLRELGLTLGQRRRYLDAIAALDQAGPGPAAKGAALELRRVTVLFCDMVDSTRLMLGLEPEEQHDLLQAYYRQVGPVIRRFGGYIASVPGDGVIVLFGYPRSPGGNASRAVGAALALQDRFAGKGLTLPDGRGIPVALRVGIASGRAVIGNSDDALSDGLHMVGPVLNRAERLQGAAGTPGAVLVDALTADQAADSFAFSDPVAMPLKGFDAPVAVSRVLGAHPHAHVAPARPPALVPSRAAILRHLAMRWDAAAGEPALIVLRAEAGMGKTTLLRATQAHVTGRGGRVLALACSVVELHRPLKPVLDWIEDRIGRSEDRSDRSRQTALAHVLDALEPGDAAVVSTWLGLEAAQQAAPAGMSAGDYRRALIGALIRLMRRGDSALLLSVEDVHWADATTLELLERLAGDAGPGRLMLVATTRPADHTPWTGLAGQEVIDLAPLDHEDADILLRPHLGDVTLPDTIRETMLDRGGGNPVMLEALVRPAIQSVQDGTHPAAQLPDSLYDSVAGQLDGMVLGQELAALLSVCGAPAELDLLAQVLARPTRALIPAIAEMRSLGILAPATGAGETVIAFRHQLFPEVIYERLIGAERRRLHGLVAEALCARDPDLPQTGPEILARHAVAARDHHAAATLSIRAGERAAAGSAMIEALHHVDQAKAAIDRLPASDARDALRLRCVVARAAIRRVLHGIHDDEVGELTREALSLARKLSDKPAERAALSGLYSFAMVRADYRAASDWADQLLQEADGAGDPTLLMLARRGHGGVALHRGEITQAVGNLRLALDTYDMTEHAPLMYQHGYDHAEICGVMLSLALWMSGDPSAARRQSDWTIAHARSLSHVHSLAQALAFRAMLATLMRDDGTMAEAGQEAADLSERVGIKVMGTAGLFFREAALHLSGKIAPDLVRLSRRHDAFLKVNPFNYGTLAWASFAELHLRLGNVSDALSALDRADTLQERTGEAWYAPELLRLRAQVTELQGDPSAATNLRGEALGIALSGGAAMLALRIGCDMVEADRSDPATVATLRKIRDPLAGLDDGWDSRRAARLLS